MLFALAGGENRNWLRWPDKGARYRPLQGQDRTIKATTTKPARAAAMPTPITQPRVANSGKGDMAVFNASLP